MLELEAGKASSIVVSGKVAVELPSWMNRLALDEVQEAEGDHVVAAGRDPSSGDIVFLTARGDLREIDVEANELRGLGTGPVRPIDHGLTLELELAEPEGFQIDHGWAVEHSTLLISVATAFDQGSVSLFPT